MPHLFLGRSQRLFLFFFLFLFFLKDTKSVHLNFQYILAALWCYTNVRAASRKVASLDWKRSCLISQSQLGPGWRRHKAGDWQQKVCSSRMERSRVKRETEWYEKKQKCSSHKTAGPHSYVHAGPQKQMLTPWFQCGVLLDWGQLLFPGHLRPYADHPHPTCPPKPPTHVQLHPHPPHPWKKSCISDRKPKWTEDYFNKEMPQGQSHQVICYQKAVTFLPPVTSDSSTWTHPSCSLSSCFCCHKPAEEAYFPQLILAG